MILGCWESLELSKTREKLDVKEKIVGVLRRRNKRTKVLIKVFGNYVLYD